MPPIPLRDYLCLSLRHRPFIWLAPLAALGAAAGMRWAMAVADIAGTAPTRDEWIFLLPLLPCLFFLYGTWRWKANRPVVRLCFGLALAFLLSSYAARRALPPSGDVSLLVKNVFPQGAVRPAQITLYGYVADDPKRGDWNCEFPFEIAKSTIQGRDAAVTGNVWLVLPPMPEMQRLLGGPLEVGDALTVQAGVIDLPGPTNPGERDGHLRFVLKGCWAAAKITKPEFVQRWDTAPHFPVARFINTLRKKLLSHYENAFQRLAAPFPHATAQLLTAMAFGEGGLIEPLPWQVRNDFRTAGMSHILVASGTQISFIVIIVLGGAQLFGLRRWPLLLFLLPVLLSYGVLAGGAASIWRAAIAGVCISLALLHGRDVDALSLWSTALLILICLDPGQVFDIGFQLSFAATWGLIVVGPIVRKSVADGLGGNFLTDLGSFSIAAQLGVAPVVAYHFGQFSPSGLGANLLGVPFAGLLVGMAVLDLIIPLAPIHWMNYYLAQFIASVASNAANLPGAQWRNLPLHLAWTVLCYMFLIASLAMAVQPKDGALRNRSRFRDDYWLPFCDEVRRAWRNQKFGRMHSAVALMLLVLALWSGWTWWREAHRPLTLTMLDVGQGESLVLRGPSGRTILIDGGGVAKFEREDVGRSVIVPYLQSAGVRYLDAVVLTHADADHCNGLPALVREVPIGMVLDGGDSAGVVEVEHNQFRQELTRHGVPVKAPHAGQKFDLGGGVTVEVLAPTSPRFDGEHADNDNGVVLKVYYGEVSLLLMADVEREAEERLVQRGVDLKCTVLKVGHHGSNSSTHELLLRAAQPKVALISCGKYNLFGHPRPQVLERLAAHNASIFRTDVQGALNVSCDTEKCWVETGR